VGSGPALGRRPLKDGGDTSTGHLVDLLADAFQKEATTIVDEIAKMAAPPNGEDSDPTRETILGYIKPPKPTVVKGKRVKRRNRETPVHYKFAHLALNYLDGRRANGRHEDVPHETSSRWAWRDARDICKAILHKERDRRFERSLGSDAGSQRAASHVAGVYAVCRRESSDTRYHQELLILRNSGSKGLPRCHCTYVAEKVVTRGEWALVGNVIYCGMSGLRDDNTHEIGGLYLHHLTEHDILSGFLAGAGTDVKLPVAMPLVAVRLTDVGKHMLDLGDLGDEAILRAFRNVKADLESVRQRLHEILSKQMEPVTFQANICNPVIRDMFDGGRQLIHSRFRDFCRVPIH
jgi:hypothetical protein